MFPDCIHPGPCIPLLLPTLLAFLHTSSQQLCLRWQHLRAAPLLFHLTPVCPCCSSPAKLPLFLPGSCAALLSPPLLIYLPPGSWDVLSRTKNLSWARKLRASESPERHLMVKYLVKDDLIPKPKREAHASYLI